MVQFSIVIPCFNHFDRMKKCLESLESQTYKNFEVIFIDDKSTDNLIEKLQEYKKTSTMNMIILQNEENKGPGFSRNKGIEKASGKYIIFLDSDDFIANNTLEEINNIIENNSPDCIIFDYNLKTRSGKIIPQKSYLKDSTEMISVEDAIIYSTGSTWCKVYLLENLKRSGILFPDLIRCEDLVFNKLAISHCEKIYYLNNALYYYVLNDASIMNQDKTLTLQNTKQAMKMIEGKMDPSFSNAVEAIFIKEYFYGMLISYIKMKKNNQVLIEHITVCEKKYPNLYENSVIHYLPKIQQICIKLAQKRKLFLLKMVMKLKEKIKKSI